MPFDATKSDIPEYNWILKDPNLTYKDRRGKVVWMTPRQYLSAAARIGWKFVDKNHKTTKAEIQHFFDFADPGVVDDYTDDLCKGDTFPLLALDYKFYCQEGRHRALAAEKAGISKVPVLIVREINTTPMPNRIKSASRLQSKLSGLSGMR